MIYLAGDIHGTLEIEKVMNFFEVECRKRLLTEEDYLILLGDAGLCWDGGKKDYFVRESLERLPVTTLWIDGNHENFDLIDAMPIRQWHGGMVQYIGKKLIHLMRGYVYNIDDKKFFAFGGGFSIDKMLRTENEDWWKREMPSEEEYERGRAILREYNGTVDYIITHTVPVHISKQLVKELDLGEEQLQYYLQEISETTVFQKWYFGHWHRDCKFENGRYIGLYDKILRLT